MAEGLPLHEIAEVICEEQRKACGDNECRCATARFAIDATVDAICTRIEALPRWMMFDGDEPLNVVRYEDVQALLEGQEHANERPPAFTDHPQDIADQEAANWDNAQESDAD